MNFKNLALIIIFLILGFFLINQPPKNIENVNLASAQKSSFQAVDIHYVKIAGQNIKIDLALTPKIQMQGLSGRKELKEREGMLFVFYNPGKYYFWMKNMNFPIDMIWLGEDLRVIYMQKNVKPASYPKTFGPDQNAKYVLEVVAGFADKNNLKIGDKTELLP